MLCSTLFLTLSFENIKESRSQWPLECQQPPRHIIFSSQPGMQHGTTVKPGQHAANQATEGSYGSGSTICFGTAVPGPCTLLYVHGHFSIGLAAGWYQFLQFALNKVCHVSAIREGGNHLRFLHSVFEQSSPCVCMRSL